MGAHTEAHPLSAKEVLGPAIVEDGQHVVAECVQRFQNNIGVATGVVQAHVRIRRTSGAAKHPIISTTCNRPPVYEDSKKLKTKTKAPPCR